MRRVTKLASHKRTIRIGAVLVVYAATILPGSTFANGTRDEVETPRLPEIAAVGLADGEKLWVVATTSILGSVVQTIGGDDIEFDLLIDTGQDPHSYQPTPSAMMEIEKAHLVFLSGFGLEEALITLVEDTTTGVVVSASAGIEAILPSKEGKKDQNPDPHVWLDPRNVIQWVVNINQTLSIADPRNSERYERRANLYVEQLENLDSVIRRLFTDIPADKRKLVTDHDSLGRLASAYGFTVITSILPSTTTAEVSPRQLAQIVEMVEKANASTIFVGESAGRDIEMLVRTVASELERDIRIVPLLIGSLAAPGTDGDTYIGLMKYNARAIVEGLSN